MKQRVIISKQLQTDLAEAIAECEHDRIFVLVDETTNKLCWTLVKDYLCLKDAQTIVIGATDRRKNLDTLVHVWESLQQGKATRHSLLINLGGGMVTDLGGFAASTYKRGINFINVPTTLLAMVDASVGGKTGINFGGLKNEIGVFNDAEFVLLDTNWLRTLDEENIRSGYAEMLKHGLIADETMWAELINFNIAQPNLHQLAFMLDKSVRIKERIVDEDPHEKGIRKALNLGHTFGHAFESWAMKHHPILHGYAVAFGLVAELYLATTQTDFPTERMRQTVNFIRAYYGSLPITCNDYPELIELMHHDKKNRGNEINVTLLGGIGDIRINQTITEEDIKEALDFFREG
ncbi:3-dehydroquinate synthase [Prevotella veroralis]|uniref:3-dehydroquinate synthase n=1 Tax=Prevotella veroralis F0319 TaxID=649761 RepID=C9MMJ8_9BACT|nr:3-dehydroquinate synthase [Prevotella veroralis]EEX19383.1 3-dehydroquinate synthase [Prevotella veroralis F0319]QUB41023.1 3-dehydroquinate synthase [Prevotella veroralis]